MEKEQEPGLDLKQVGRHIFTEALKRCTVEQAFATKLLPCQDKPHCVTLEGYGHIDLSEVERLVVVSIGKAGGTLLKGLLQRLALPGNCELLGVVVAPEEPDPLPSGVEYFAGGHPLPNEQSFAAARAALRLTRRASQDAAVLNTFCFFLISGGASAMMELPLDESVSLKDTVAFYRALVHCGASIAEINCVRKHFSAIKGGRLGLAARSMRNLTILVSDVPPQDLDALASGPTLPDSSTVEQCLEILERHDLLANSPTSVREFFSSPGLVETPKPGRWKPDAVTLLSSGDLAAAAAQEAEALGFFAVVDNTCDEWDFHQAATYLLSRLRALRLLHPRVCLISTGEVTVELPPETRHGVGGRNQHFALYAATLLHDTDGSTCVLSAGSDGIDGNSPAAGAVLDANTLAAVPPEPGAVFQSLSEAAIDALAGFDSFTFLNPCGATLHTGPTGNNLRDLRLLLAREN